MDDIFATVDDDARASGSTGFNDDSTGVGALGSLFEDSPSTYGPYNKGQGPDTLSTSREGARFIGLRNQGATCYLNSLIQMLYMTPEFRTAMYSLETSEDEMMTIPMAVRNLFANLNLSEDISVETDELTNAFGWNQSETIVQHDIAELRRILVDILGALLEGTHPEVASQVSNLFKYELDDQKRCCNCNNITGTEGVFLELTVMVEGCENLDQSIRKFFEPETIEDYKCEKCGEVTEVSKGYKIKSLPSVLSFALMRFKLDMDTFENVKVNSRLEFPFELNVRDVLDNSILPENEDSVYVLYGVGIHSGSAYAGHYHAFIRDFYSGASGSDNDGDGDGNAGGDGKETVSGGGTWYDYNDSVVTKVDDIVEVIEKEYGGTSSSAYFLLYRRKDNVVDTGIHPPDVPQDLKDKIEAANVALLADIKRQEDEANSVHVTIQPPTVYDMVNGWPEQTGRENSMKLEVDLRWTLDHFVDRLSEELSDSIPPREKLVIHEVTCRKARLKLGQRVFSAGDIAAPSCDGGSTTDGAGGEQSGGEVKGDANESKKDAATTLRECGIKGSATLLCWDGVHVGGGVGPDHHWKDQIEKTEIKLKHIQSEETVHETELHCATLENLVSYACDVLGLDFGRLAFHVDKHDGPQPIDLTNCQAALDTLELTDGMTVLVEEMTPAQAVKGSLHVEDSLAHKRWKRETASVKLFVVDDELYSNSHEAVTVFVDKAGTLDDVKEAILACTGIPLLSDPQAVSDVRAGRKWLCVSRLFSSGDSSMITDHGREAGESSSTLPKVGLWGGERLIVSISEQDVVKMEHKFRCLWSGSNDIVTADKITVNCLRHDTIRTFKERVAAEVCENAEAIKLWTCDMFEAPQRLLENDNVGLDTEDIRPDDLLWATTQEVPTQDMIRVHTFLWVGPTYLSYFDSPEAIAAGSGQNGDTSHQVEDADGHVNAITGSHRLHNRWITFVGPVETYKPHKLFDLKTKIAEQMSTSEQVLKVHPNIAKAPLTAANIRVREWTGTRLGRVLKGDQKLVRQQHLKDGQSIAVQLVHLPDGMDQDESQTSQRGSLVQMQRYDGNGFCLPTEEFYNVGPKPTPEEFASRTSETVHVDIAFLNVIRVYPDGSLKQVERPQVPQVEDETNATPTEAQSQAATKGGKKSKQSGKSGPKVSVPLKDGDVFCYEDLRVKALATDAQGHEDGSLVEGESRLQEAIKEMGVKFTAGPKMEGGKSSTARVKHRHVEVDLKIHAPGLK
eukprot:GFYU01005037.1.p1 GENE.GFYU01005037.1~~GFYU01005037.1.p1  ORF type:complete len:1244 (-),score=329.25 GFYU01005037.1:31-3762(-)